MKYTIDQKILHCKEAIKKNNKIIMNTSRANNRLFESLVDMMKELPIETKLRYDKELASEEWKNTQYYKNNQINK